MSRSVPVSLVVFVLAAVPVAAQKPVREFTGFMGEIRTVTFSPDGKSIAASGLSADVRVWDVASGKLTLLLEGQGGNVHTVAYSRDGKSLTATGFTNGTVQFWDAATGKATRLLEKHKYANIQHLAFSPDGTILATTGSSACVYLWDAASGKLLHAVEDPNRFGWVVAFSPDGRLLAQGGNDHLSLWDVKAGKRLHSWEVPGHVNGVVFSRDGKRIYAGNNLQILHEIDAATGKVLRTQNTGRGGLRFFSLSPDGHSLAVANDLGSAQIWELATLKQRRHFTTDKQFTTGIAFSPDGKTLATGGQDQVVRLWDVTEGWSQADLTIPFKEAELNECWKNLAGDDVPLAYNAVWALSTRTKESLPFLAKRLVAQPGQAIDAKKVARWIAELDDDAFDTREAATKELGQLGRGVRHALETALMKPRSAEQRARIEKLLKAIAPDTLTPERLRRIRVAEALEKIDTDESRRLLEKLKANP